MVVSLEAHEHEHEGPQPQLVPQGQFVLGQVVLLKVASASWVKEPHVHESPHPQSPPSAAQPQSAHFEQGIKRVGWE